MLAESSKYFFAAGSSKCLKKYFCGFPARPKSTWVCFVKRILRAKKCFWQCVTSEKLVVLLITKIFRIYSPLSSILLRYCGLVHKLTKLYLQVCSLFLYTLSFFSVVTKIYSISHILKSLDSEIQISLKYREQVALESGGKPQKKNFCDFCRPLVGRSLSKNFFRGLSRRLKI